MDKHIKRAYPNVKFVLPYSPVKMFRYISFSYIFFLFFVISINFGTQALDNVFIHFF